MTSSSELDPGIEAGDAVVAQLSRAGIVVEGVEPLVGGYGGASFLASTGNGRVVVKVRSDRRPLIIARIASDLMASRGLPHQSVIVPPTRVAAEWMIGLEWLPGSSLTDDPVEGWSADEAAGLGRDLGRWLATLHTIRSPGRRWLAKADSRFAAKVERSIERGHLGPDLLSQLRAFWARLRPALEDAPLSLIHRDLQPRNIVARGRAFVGVIDLEQCRVADPLYDLVKLREWTLAAHPSVAPAFVDAYGLNLERPDVRDRLAAVCALEYLSAVVYFDKRGNLPKIADQKEMLVDLLRNGVTIP